jgi:hypothetical protein
VTGFLSVILWPMVDFTIDMLPATDIVNKLIPVIFSPARS